MFQKSLQILVASALLALAATVGYSFLRLHGPEDTLAEARARLAAAAAGRPAGRRPWFIRPGAGAR